MLVHFFKFIVAVVALIVLLFLKEEGKEIDKGGQERWNQRFS